MSTSLRGDWHQTAIAPFNKLPVSKAPIFVVPPNVKKGAGMLVRPVVIVY